MNSKPDTLPRTILGVEAWLREQARPDMAQDYPFLFGMATAKLAEAHSEIARLRRELADAEAEADRAPHDDACSCTSCQHERARMRRWRWTVAEHTPGPWLYVGSAAVEAGKRARFKFMLTPNGAPEQEWEANARLIAAAPELLAGVRHLGESGHRFGSVASEGCAECVAARAAIEKAEDRS